MLSVKGRGLCYELLGLVLGVCLLFAGEHKVGDDAEDQRAGDRSDGDGLTVLEREVERKTANARDEDDGYDEQVAVFVEIDGLEHLKTRYRNEAVQRHTHAAHYAAGDSLKHYHQGFYKAQYNAH